jgi:hypothetical protein
VGANKNGKRHLSWVFAILLALEGLICAAWAEEAPSPTSTEVEIHLDLTRQFYEALERTQATQSRSLSTDRSERYLEQIAVSTRFMVETNLRLLKQQAEIKALLNELLNASRQ